MTSPARSGLYAHTPREGSDSWHPLVDHLEAVAELASSFGAKFVCSEICQTLGYDHDLARAHPRFQNILGACLEGSRNLKEAACV